MVLVEDIRAVGHKVDFGQAFRERVVLVEPQALGLRDLLAVVRKEAVLAVEELRGRVELDLVLEAHQGWALLSQLAAVRKVAVLAPVGLAEHKEAVPVRAVLGFEDLFGLAARLVDLVEHREAVQVEAVQVALVHIAVVPAADQQAVEKHRYNTPPQHLLLDVLAVEHSQLEAKQHCMRSAGEECRSSVVVGRGGLGLVRLAVLDPEREWESRLVLAAVAVVGQESHSSVELVAEEESRIPVELVAEVGTGLQREETGLLEVWGLDCTLCIEDSDLAEAEFGVADIDLVEHKLAGSVAVEVVDHILGSK